MLDPFFLSHREVVIRNDQRRFIEEFTFGAAVDLAAASLDPPDRTFLAGTHSVGDNMAFYGLWARRHLREVRTHNKILGHKRLAHMDEKLLQIILLHKLIPQLDPKDPQHLTARSAIGAMIQRDLTLLLAEVKLEQWNRIFMIWKLRGVSATEWETHLAGASAATHTLMTLASRDWSRVFLPTGHEDIHEGIDLFWLEEGYMHAVSVKCITGQRDPVRAWRVDTLPVNGIGDPVLFDQRTIFLGAQRFAASEGRPCIPVLVHVAKPEGGPIRLKQNWNRLIWPDQLLLSQDQPTHENEHSLAR